MLCHADLIRLMPSQSCSDQVLLQILVFCPLCQLCEQDGQQGKSVILQVLEILDDKHVRVLREGKQPKLLSPEEAPASAAWSWWQRERKKMSATA